MSRIEGNQIREFFKKEPSFLRIDKLQIFGDGKEKVIVNDPSQPSEKQKREGQFFVKLPEGLAKILPGSTFGPDEFLGYLSSEGEVKNTSEEILGGKEGLDFTFESEAKDFSLEVFRGSTNKQGLEIARLAKKFGQIARENSNRPEGNKINDSKQRAKYQGHLYGIMKPILAKESEYNLRIIEDCIASGETIAGVLAALAEKSKIPVGGKIRVDVAVATTQGILVLREFARQNNLNLEINVGYLAYGLSRGVDVPGTNARAHANYITYPPGVLADERISVKARAFLADQADEIDQNVYVVGDMGDIGKSMRKEYDSRYPWNSFRIDKHGDRNEIEINLPLFFDENRPAILYFANGGYLMKAMRGLAVPNIWANQVVFDAKRVWAQKDEYGYGVLIKNIPEELLAGPKN